MRLSFAVVALFTSSLVPAVSQTPAKLKLPELKYETYTLPNGLKVITHEDHRLPLVAVDLWYHVGPLNERPGRTGFAHLFEHMMFEGSEHVGEKAHIKYVEGVGATDVNGTTDFDRTNYFETLPANQLELGLWLESDRMGFLMEGLDRTKLANQRDVVRNERRQGEGTPYSLSEEEAMHLLFPQSHPYYASVIGSHADIEAARIADVRDFHQQFYTPNNASIAIAGDFNPAQLKTLLRRYFGPIPKGPEATPVTVTTPPITSQKRATVADTVKLERVSIAFLTPASYTPQSYDLEVISNTLAQGKAARLTQVLVNQKQIAQSVSCDSSALKLTGIFNCDLTAKPGSKIADLEAIFWDEIAKLQTSGPTAEEVESAKTGILTRQISGLQRLGGFGGVADTLDKYNQYTGDPGFLPKEVAMLQSVTPASVKTAAAQFLNKQQAVVVTTVPGPKVLHEVPRSPEDTDANVTLTPAYTQAFEASQAFRKTPPAGPELAFHIAPPKTFTLRNGLKVLFVEDRSLPVISVQLTARAGGENNPTGKAGLASLNAAVMAEATKTRDLTKLAEDQRKIGASINVRAGMDSASASLTVTSNNTDSGMDLLADVIERPAYNAADFDRLRQRRLVAIAQQTDNVQTVAQNIGPQLLYNGAPYGQPSIGTVPSITALTPADLTAFYSAHFGPSDSALTLAGDISEAQARRLAEKYFGNWSGEVINSPQLPPAPAQPLRHIVLIDKPGAPQTALVAFGLGKPQNDPDHEAIDVMNFTLGGAFASRINMNLREDHGYTYGAFSNFSDFREGGTFLAGALVRTDVTGPAATELFKELQRFPGNPPTPAELKESRDSNIQSIPGQFETTAAVANALSQIFIYNRPLDFYTTLPDKYRAVAAADVTRVAAADIHPDNLILVAVGDKASIEAGLKAANLGAIEYRALNGDPVAPESK